MNGTTDLHCHSTASDGTLSPAELVARAHARGVERLALTDHDTVAGLAAAAAAARALGVELITGIELSASWSGRSLHVVGLGLEPEAPALTALIEELDRLRAQRARAMGESLARHGIPGAHAGALALVGEGNVPTRTHFARYLVGQGHARDVGAVFKRFLVRGKPGYVGQEWPALERVVEVIRQAGGLAVLAHPHAYDMTGAWRRRMLDAFREAGGDGVEVVCGNSTRDSILVWGGYARRYGLLASVGSDFHAPEGWVELGRLAELPADLVPVWSQLPF